MKLNLETVSIIIPVYNAQKYLTRCIQSVLKQTYQKFELILVNDGSNDDSLTICNEYKEKDNRIKVLDNPNEGAGMARNAGLDLATGSYVLFIDADDWIAPEMLECLLQLLISSQSDISICNNFIDQADGSASFSSPMPIETDPFITNDIPKCVGMLEGQQKFPYLWNRLYKRQIITQNQIRFEKQFITGEDLDFNLKYFTHVQKCAITNKAYYHYIKAGVDSLCARYKAGLYGIVNELNRRREELYRNMGMLKDESYKTIYERIYIDYLRTCVPNMFRKKAQLTGQERLVLIKEVFTNKDLKQYIKGYEARSRVEKIFKILVRLGNARIALMVYTLLFWVRNEHDDIYQKLRGERQ